MLARGAEVTSQNSLGFSTVETIDLARGKSEIEITFAARGPRGDPWNLRRRFGFCVVILPYLVSQNMCMCVCWQGKQLICDCWDFSKLVGSSLYFCSVLQRPFIAFTHKEMVPKIITGLVWTSKKSHYTFEVPFLRYCPIPVSPCPKCWNTSSFTVSQYSLKLNYSKLKVIKSS